MGQREEREGQRDPYQSEHEYGLSILRFNALATTNSYTQYPENDCPESGAAQGDHAGSERFERLGHE